MSLKTKLKIFFLLIFLFSSVSYAKCDFKKESSKLKDGIIKHQINLKNERQNIVIHILEIDPENKHISFKAALPDENQIKTKERLTNIVLKNMAYAGINSNYFDVKEGNTIGTFITDGILLVGPVFDRASVGFTQDREILIDNFMIQGHATVRDSSLMFDIKSLNVPYHLIKEAGLYTPVWGEEVNVKEEQNALVLENSCVVDVRDGLVQIPPNGYVILFNKESNLKKGDCLEITWEQSPHWQGVKEAVSGGPYLVMDSMPFIDWESEGFKPPTQKPYTARTAIGIGKNKNLFLVLVEGDKKDNSGLSLPELSGFLVDFGLQDAINLDGGGSSTLVIDGKVINKLYDKHERKISSGLLIFYND